MGLRVVVVIVVPVLVRGIRRMRRRGRVAGVEVRLAEQLVSVHAEHGSSLEHHVADDAPEAADVVEAVFSRLHHQVREVDHRAAARALAGEGAAVDPFVCAGRKRVAVRIELHVQGEGGAVTCLQPGGEV